MDKTELLNKIQEKIQLEGRTSLYNPLLQKPTSLNPVGPGSYPAGFGGYAYIGPPPDFGGSYGAFQDSGGRTQVGTHSSKMFSMWDGTPVQLKSELSPEEREALLTQIEESSEKIKCQGCRSELTISMAQNIESKELHCPYCSSVMEGAMEKVKLCVSKVEEKKMKDLAKEAMKVDPPKEVNPHEKPEKAQLLDHKDAEKNVTEVKPLEELAKAPVQADAEEEEKAKKAKAEADAKAAADEEEKAKKAKAEAEEKAKAASAATAAVDERKAKLKASVEKYVQRRKEMAEKARTARVAARKEKGNDFDNRTLAHLKRELRIMAAIEPAKFAENKKNPKLAAICAEVEKKLYSKEVRAQVRAELKVLAAEDMEAHDEALKELEFVAPEILMEEQMSKPSHMEEESEEAKKAKAEAEEKAKAAQGAESEEEKAKKAKSAEEAEAAKPAQAEDEMMKAMKTEYLASLDTLKGEKIEMSLYGEEGEDPYWNLTVDGEPTARIHLQDQKDAEQIKAGFTSDSYAENLGNAIQKVGLKKMLGLANARIFAHQIDEKEVTARLREKAKAEVKAEMEEKITTLRSDFLRSVSLAMVAANKNFYQEEARHALKGCLFNALVQAGLTEQHAVWAIEAGFEEAPVFFDFVMDKAVEIMDMPKEAAESLEKSIMASGKIELATKEPEDESLVDRLVKSSVSAIAMGGVVSGENRQNIREQLGLSPVRR